MAEQIAVENGRISNFQGLVALTWFQVTRHTIVHHSSTSNHMPNGTEIDWNWRNFVDGHLRPTLLGQLRRVDLTQNNLIDGCVSRQVVSSMKELCLSGLNLNSNSTSAASAKSERLGFAQVRFKVDSLSEKLWQMQS